MNVVPVVFPLPKEAGSETWWSYARPLIADGVLLEPQLGRASLTISEEVRTLSESVWNAGLLTALPPLLQPVVATGDQQPTSMTLIEGPQPTRESSIAPPSASPSSEPILRTKVVVAR